MPRERAAIAERAAERAREAGDRVGEALALVVAAQARLHFADDPDVDELERLARAALPLLEQAEDHAGLAHVWGALGTASRTSAAGSRSGRRRRSRRSATSGSRAGAAQGWPVFPPRSSWTAAGRRGTADARFCPAGESAARGAALPSPAARHARPLRRSLALARPAVERARGARRAPPGDSARETATSPRSPRSPDDHATAAGNLRRDCDTYERGGARARLSTLAPQLGRSLCALGRYDEAEPLAQLGRELGDEQDIITQMLWRQVQARVHAHRGQHTDAERLAREAEAIAERTDALNSQGDALCDLAEVLAAAGRTEEAAQTLERALSNATSARKPGDGRPGAAALEALRETMPA